MNIIYRLTYENGNLWKDKNFKLLKWNYYMVGMVSASLSMWIEFPENPSKMSKNEIKRQ